EMTCTCPAGQVTGTLVTVGRTMPRTGEYEKGQAFQFDGAVCDACELRAQCSRAGPGKGRTVSLHPQERLLQEARALQASPDFQQYQRMRQASEHRLARMVQLGVRKARYFGRSKTLFQALMAATVANLTLIARKTGEMGHEGGARADLGLLLSHLAGLFKGMIDHVFVQICPKADIFRFMAISRPGFRPSF
ncbi:MAG TPA: hypothetical protein ENL35_01530, partial [Chloroflexi bacterium]|nr:hypothetical protein [Chloroflexota bacterium]